MEISSVAFSSIGLLATIIVSGYLIVLSISKLFTTNVVSSGIDDDLEGYINGPNGHYGQG